MDFESPGWEDLKRYAVGVILGSLGGGGWVIFES